MTYRMQWNAKFCCHQHNSHDFIQPTKTASIHLDVVQCFSLKELLKHDAVLAVLPSGDFDIVFAEGGANSGMAENVVRRCWFFDEERFELCKFCEVRLGFRDGPDL